MELTVRNVNDAFHRLVKLFHKGRPPVRRGKYGNPNGSGDVLVIDGPVTLTYLRPTERVLLNHARDANPFFHLYEALWMLAGRNDVAPLAYYSSQVVKYSDDGKTFNGAYGHRWRNTYIDQLNMLVAHLKTNPTSRRAVLQMWNVKDDLPKIGGSKDVCCNLCVMFSLGEEVDEATNGHEERYRYLDMTVVNRSNDLVLGMLGANVVHFSVLQEYVAARLGVEVGVYHHFTNNLHVYPDHPSWKPKAYLEEYEDRDMHSAPVTTYDSLGSHMPLVQNPTTFEAELPTFVNVNKAVSSPESGSRTGWNEPFFKKVAQPMLSSFHFHKHGDTDVALRRAMDVEDDAWRFVTQQWLQRRLK